jgi:hypothetical protein
VTKETKILSQEKCPRCGNVFHCSKSGKCWCYEVMVPADRLEMIEEAYDTCLCPACLNELAKPVYGIDGKITLKSLIYQRKSDK